MRTRNGARRRAVRARQGKERKGDAPTVKKKDKK